MNNTNYELVQLMTDLHLSRAEVANCLDVPLVIVKQWTASDADTGQETISESDLRLLKYAMMTENRDSHIF